MALKITSLLTLFCLDGSTLRGQLGSARSGQLLSTHSQFTVSFRFSCFKCAPFLSLSSSFVSFFFLEILMSRVRIWFDFPDLFFLFQKSTILVVRSKLFLINSKLIPNDFRAGFSRNGQRDLPSAGVANPKGVRGAARLGSFS